MPASRLRSTTTPAEDDGKLDMSPMIDMVFLLLIFFIVNATAIIVRTDPDVVPPTADNARNPPLNEGRIVINVRGDGTYTAEDLTVLPDEAAIQHYVQQARDEMEQRSLTAKLHLRGDKDSLFKHGRVAVRAAANAGVEQVLFATFNREP